MRRMYSQNELKNLIQEQVSSGQLENVKVFENIVDKDGHPRFIEGDFELPATWIGLSNVYAKWSLSGTHLMIVIAAQNEANAVIDNIPLEIPVPEWVKEKIKPIYRDDYVDLISFSQRSSSTLSVQNINVSLRKTSTRIIVTALTSTTFLEAGGFRFAFDLIIDNE